MFLAQFMVLLVKAEVTYGVDPVPDATNAILCTNISIDPVLSQIANRQKAHPTLGLDPDVHTNVFQQITFDVGLAGSGDAGTAPLYGALLRGCGFSETIDADIDVKYQPFVSVNQTSLTIYFNWGGKRFKLTGARGTVSFFFGPNGLPYMRFTFTGLRNPAASAVLTNVEGTLASWLQEIEVNKANTTFTFFSITPTLQNFQLDVNNTVTARDRPNASVVTLTNGGCKGQAAFEMPIIGGGLDVDAVAVAGTLGNLHLTHGTVAGNIVELACSNVQLLQPKPNNTDGILHAQTNFACVRNPGGPSVGLDDVLLTVS